MLWTESKGGMNCVKTDQIFGQKIFGKVTKGKLSMKVFMINIRRFQHSEKHVTADFQQEECGEKNELVSNLIILGNGLYAQAARSSSRWN